MCDTFYQEDAPSVCATRATRRTRPLSVRHILPGGHAPCICDTFYQEDAPPAYATHSTRRVRPLYVRHILSGRCAPGMCDTFYQDDPPDPTEGPLGPEGGEG